jgi:U6 snRNA-associated Sm-like protein LSm2
MVSASLALSLSLSLSRLLARSRCRRRLSPPPVGPSQLFYSFFKTLVGKEIAVELKNDVALTGVLHSVDQYLNVKLRDVHVVDKERFPQLVPMKNCFIRGSVVRYVQISKADVDVELLQDATLKEHAK